MTVATPTNDGYYVDIVGFTNQLIDGHKYQYAIIAKSLTSPNRSISTDDVIFNGSANSNEITATIPETSPITAPSATVTVEKNLVVVQWTNATVLPSFVDYEAEYTVSSPDGMYPFVATLSDDTNSRAGNSEDKYFVPKQRISFPYDDNDISCRRQRNRFIEKRE